MAGFDASLLSAACEALTASTILIVLVLMLRHTVRHRFGPHIAYWLWALPALRLVLPPLPIGATLAGMPAGGAGAIIAMAKAGTTDAPHAATWFAGVWPLVAVWAAGALGFLGWHVVRHHLFCRRILAAATTIERDGRIHIVTSTAATGPLAFGVVRPVIAFPAGEALSYDPAERALALAHEHAHHWRGDLAANWIALVVLALHWFNPIAWIGFRAFRFDQELACDAQVMANRSAIDRQAYGRAIVKAAAGASIAATCHLHTAHVLKRRLKMLGIAPVSRRRLAGGSLAVAGLTLAGLGLTASHAGIAAAPVRTIVVQTVPPAAPVLLVGGKSVPAADAPAKMLGLPKDFVATDMCKPGTTTPLSMVIKNPDDSTYTVTCTGGIAATAERDAYRQALAGLHSVRGQIATQAASQVFPETERTRALAAVDVSIAEIESDLGPNR